MIALYKEDNIFVYKFDETKRSYIIDYDEEINVKEWLITSHYSHGDQ